MGAGKGRGAGTSKGDAPVFDGPSSSGYTGPPPPQGTQPISAPGFVSQAQQQEINDTRIQA